MIWRTPPHLWSIVEVVQWGGHVFLARYCHGTGSPVLTDDVATDKNSKINSEEPYYLLRLNQILQNLVDGASPWTMNRRIVWKQPKTLLRQNNLIVCNDQVSHQTWLQLSMHYSCWKNDTSKPTRNWRQLTEKKPGIWPCLWVPDFIQSLTARDLQPSIKSDNLFYDYVSLSKFESAN